MTEPVAGTFKISPELRIIFCSHMPASCTVVPILSHTSHFLQALRTRFHCRVLVLFSWARLFFPLDIYRLVPSFPLGFVTKCPFQDHPHPSLSNSRLPNVLCSHFSLLLYSLMGQHIRMEGRFILVHNYRKIVLHQYTQIEPTRSRNEHQRHIPSDLCQPARPRSWRLYSLLNSAISLNQAFKT